MKTFVKDPDAILDYVWDWNDWLEEGDSIDSFVIYTPTGMTEVSSSEADGKVTVWFSMGDDFKSYKASCSIDTVFGRHDTRSVIFNIEPR